MESISGITSFVRTASTGSFSEAARQLGITTVSVSRNVQRLERELGVRLLNRTTRSLSLTDEGRVLFDASRNLLSGLDAARLLITERRGQPSGLLRVSTVRVFGRLFVVPLLKEFRARYPNVQIELLAADRIVDMIDEGFDVGIRTGAVPDSSIIVRELAALPRVVCAAPSYIATHGQPTVLSDLAIHDCIGQRSPTTGRLTPWEFGPEREHAIGLRMPLLFNDMLAIRDAAIAGHGVAQLPAYLMAPHIRDGRLVPMLLDHLAPGAPLYIQYAARRLLPARVRVFVDYLLEKLGNHPDLTRDPRTIARATRAVCDHSEIASATLDDEATALPSRTPLRASRCESHPKPV